MIKNKVNTYKNRLIAAIYLSVGIASIFFLSANHLNYVYSESDYLIKSKLNGLVLEIRASNPLPGAFVQTWTQNNGLNQQWTITDEGFIKSKLNGLVLEIRAADPRPGAFVQTWTQNNGLNQQWTLEEFSESTSNNSSNLVN
jgi:Ricin-type beta-trefoil lectin domain